MKLMNIEVADLEKLFATIDGCEDAVYLVSPDIRLNLKSKVAQYFSLANIFASGAEEIKEMEIETVNPKDLDKLLNFLIRR